MSWKAPEEEERFDATGLLARHRIQVSPHGPLAHGQDVTPDLGHVMEVNRDLVLHSGQSTLNPEVLAHYREHGPAEPFPDAWQSDHAEEGLEHRPTVVTYRGKHWLTDGTHRALVSRERGEPSFTAWHVDPERERREYEQWQRGASAKPDGGLPPVTASGPVTASEAAMPLATAPPPGQHQAAAGEPDRPVTWVRTDALMPHREWHHGPGWSKAPDGTIYAPKHTPEEWAANVRSVAQEGLREPVHLAFDPKANRAYISEGNSRLAWAAEAGRQAVPVTGHRVSWTPEGDAYQLPGPSPAAGIRERHRDHIPADLHPAEFLPASYLAAEPDRIPKTGTRVYDKRLPREDAEALVRRRIDKSDLVYKKDSLGLQPDHKLADHFELEPIKRTDTPMHGGAPYSVLHWGVRVNGHPAGYITTNYEGTRHKLLPYGYGPNAEPYDEGPEKGNARTAARRPAINPDDYFSGGVDDISQVPWAQQGQHIGLDEHTWAGMPVEDVPVAGMKRTQKHIYRKHLQGKGDDRQGSRDHPWVVEHNGERWVIDGHHRVVDAADSGAPTVRARVMRPGFSREASVGEAAAEHERWYHITDNPHFSLHPEYAPEDNSISIEDRSGRKGIYLTKSPERWVNGHDYVRPYAAEIHAHPSVQDAPGVHGRWSGEMFVPAEHYHHLNVHRVIPLDAHAREEYGSHGWIEEHHGTEFDTGKPIEAPGWNAPPDAHYPHRGYHYPGDARSFTPAEHEHHKERALTYLRENRRMDPEDVDHLRQHWASAGPDPRDHSEDMHTDYVAQHWWDPSIPKEKFREAERPYLDHLKGLISDQGMRRPIEIKKHPSGRTYIDDGLHRLLVAEELKMKAVPVTFKTPGGYERPSTWQARETVNRMRERQAVLVSPAAVERDGTVASAHTAAAQEAPATVRLYHGTTLRRARQIAQSGFRYNREAERDGVGERDWTLTTDPAEGRRHGLDAGRYSRDVPPPGEPGAVVAMDVPAHHLHGQPQDLGNGHRWYAARSDIPAAHVRSVTPAVWGDRTAADRPGGTMSTSAGRDSGGRESVRHILDNYRPSDFPTWDEVRAGREDVPVRQHEGFMDPDDPDPYGHQESGPWLQGMEEPGHDREAG